MSPVDPEGPAGQIPVSRASVEQLGTGVRWLLAMTVAFGLLFGWSAWQDQLTDARQDRADAASAATNERLGDLVQANERRAERDEAQECVTSHVRYTGLLVLLERLGQASDDLTDEEVGGLLAGYPAPSCDRAAAQRVLDQP